MRRNSSSVITDSVGKTRHARDKTKTSLTFLKIRFSKWFNSCPVVGNRMNDKDRKYIFDSRNLYKILTILMEAQYLCIFLFRTYLVYFPKEFFLSQSFSSRKPLKLTNSCIPVFVVCYNKCSLHIYLPSFYEVDLYLRISCDEIPQFLKSFNAVKTKWR